MMKDIAKHFFLILFSLGLVFAATSCSSKSKEFKRIPQTAFITHYEPNSKNVRPFESFWENEKLKDPEAVHASNPNRRLYLYIKPVTLKYLVNNKLTVKYRNDIEDLRKYYDAALFNAFTRRESEVPGFQVVTKPMRGAYTLEVAILSVVPTPVTAHVLNDILDVFEAPAGLILGQLEPKGSISMAARFTDPMGRPLAELADYRKDQSALLGDLKDLELFAHQRRQIRLWSTQLAQTFTCPRGARIKGNPVISLVPF